HERLRHPRPGGGARRRRPRGGDEPRAHRADGHAAGGVRAPGHPVRDDVHRPVRGVRGHRAGGQGFPRAPGRGLSRAPARGVTPRRRLRAAARARCHPHRERRRRAVGNPPPRQPRGGGGQAGAVRRRWPQPPGRGDPGAERGAPGPRGRASLRQAAQAAYLRSGGCRAGHPRHPPRAASLSPKRPARRRLAPGEDYGNLRSWCLTDEGPMKRVLMLMALISLSLAPRAMAGPPAQSEGDAPRRLGEALRSGTADAETIATIVRWVLEEKEENVAPALAAALGAAAGDVHPGTVDPRWSAAARGAIALFEGLLDDAGRHRRRDEASVARDLAPII